MDLSPQLPDECCEVVYGDDQEYEQYTTEERSDAGCDGARGEAAIGTEAQARANRERREANP